MTPLIIEGVPRSGTRFFCNFIEKQFEITIFRIQRIIREFDKFHIHNNARKNEEWARLFFLKMKNDMTLKERLGDIEEFVTSKKAEKSENFLNDLLAWKAETMGVKYWGLKFDNPSGMQICNRLFPECKFIHIIRDGRDVHLSACKCLDEGYYTPYNNAIFWSNLIINRRKFGKSLGSHRYLEIKYEDLLESPIEIANRISDFISNSNYKYTEVEIKKGNIQKWKTGMNRRAIKTYEALAGDTLKKFDYEITYKNPRLSKADILFYESMELPLKTKRYIVDSFDPEKRKRIIRMFKILKNRHFTAPR